MARVEFLACMDDVESMLGKGFSRQLIYEELKEAGKITMAYVTFAKLIVKASKSPMQLPSIRPALTPASTPAETSETPHVETPAPKSPVSRPSQPNVIKARSDALQDPRTIDPSTVI